MDGEEEVGDYGYNRGSKVHRICSWRCNYSTFHLRNEEINMDDTIEMTYPGAERLTEYFQSIYGLAPADGDIMIQKILNRPTHATSAKTK